MVPYKLLLLLSEDEPVKHAPMRFTPGGCCPCGVQQCAPITNTVETLQWDVTLALWANNPIVISGFPCVTCQNINGTYRVRFSAGCVWDYSTGTAFDCSELGTNPLQLVRLFVVEEGPHIVLRVQVFGPSAALTEYRVIIQAGSTAPMDVSAISGLNVPYLTDNDLSDACEQPDTTCTVTAVP